MRKIFVAFAAALLVSVGNAVSLRQFQARDNNALANGDDNNFQRPAPREGQENDEQRQPKDGRKRAQKLPPPRRPRQDQENDEDRPPQGLAQKRPPRPLLEDPEDDEEPDLIRTDPNTAEFIFGSQEEQEQIPPKEGRKRVQNRPPARRPRQDQENDEEKPPQGLAQNRPTLEAQDL